MREWIVREGEGEEGGEGGEEVRGRASRGEWKTPATSH